MLVVASDLDAVSGRIEGGSDTLVFQKTDAAGRPFVVRYARSGNTLTRTVSGPMGERTQSLLSGVRATAGPSNLAGLGWSPLPPPVAATTGPDQVAQTTPTVRAIALDLTTVGPGGGPVSLRRVVATPEIAP